ncbi:hypothetical protein [Variovorax rhizosphaerae]|uniref:Uncharacterized protein n=1 Tax=Variovorax rhizosphaerae TaxID=1836200 RepID=A0ABU8WLA8_9BURK
MRAAVYFHCNAARYDRGGFHKQQHRGEARGQHQEAGFGERSAMAVAQRAGAFVAALCLAACAMPANAHDAITDVRLLDFRSEAPESCRPSDVALTDVQAGMFFLRARPVDAMTLHDNYEIAPCNIEGTMKRNAESCDWKIRPGGTGSIHCGAETEYVVCDGCAELFEGK